jgi:transcriptional regulator with XRE-family HTH domain
MGGNVTQSLVSHWERGLHSATLQNVSLLAGVLGCEPKDLMPDDLLARIEAGDPGILRRLTARGVVIEIPSIPAARPVCSACSASWSDGHKCRKVRKAA